MQYLSVFSKAAEMFFFFVCVFRVLLEDQGQIVMARVLGYRGHLCSVLAIHVHQFLNSVAQLTTTKSPAPACLGPVWYQILIAPHFLFKITPIVIYVRRYPY